MIPRQIERKCVLGLSAGAPVPTSHTSCRGHLEDRALALRAHARFPHPSFPRKRESTGFRRRWPVGDGPLHRAVGIHRDPV